MRTHAGISGGIVTTEVAIGIKVAGAAVGWIVGAWVGIAVAAGDGVPISIHIAGVGFAAVGELQAPRSSARIIRTCVNLIFIVFNPFQFV
ncbi:hypothetical protein A2Z33_04405 [Candidatus Gottesmanbacteria bacterium RBG_16_52_11]|uniref:Uncharacterized protein n=1 Tax=Candidatus Gottesmanbacteria bacterium RBG_16_52_11 TaxID=1798374 RepID=A0A1F5YWB8_9BACT|nr:MAG: hypothetical protein A2Z33_04405 [Candidatus Gottesmanbacteria bacterium RBG_16_52_11]